MPGIIGVGVAIPLFLLVVVGGDEVVLVDEVGLVVLPPIIPEMKEWTQSHNQP